MDDTNREHLSEVIDNWVWTGDVVGPGFEKPEPLFREINHPDKRLLISSALRTKDDPVLDFSFRDPRRELGTNHEQWHRWVKAWSTYFDHVMAQRAITERLILTHDLNEEYVAEGRWFSRWWKRLFVFFRPDRQYIISQTTD